MKRYLVTMFNEFGCAIDGDILAAEDREDAIQKWIEENRPRIYSGDRFEAVEYWD